MDKLVENKNKKDEEFASRPNNKATKLIDLQVSHDVQSQW